MSKVHWFDMGPWPLYLGFTQCDKAFAREMKRMRVDDPPQFIASTHAGATTHSFTGKGGHTIIITLGSCAGRSKEQIAALIAHEAVHVAQYLWEDIGERLPGKEAESYLVQHIVQRCLYALRPKKAKSAPSKSP